MAITLS